MDVSDSHTLWERIHRQTNQGTLTPLQAVCNPDLSPFANRLLDRMHRRAASRLLDLVPPAEGGQRALDAGCGQGRWLGAWRARGYRTYGFDISVSALGAAATRGRCINATLEASPFRDGSFAAISTITVLQHTPPHIQIEAAAALGALVRHGGYWLMIEHVCDKPGQQWPGMYPRTVDQWKTYVEQAGFDILRAGCFQYTPVLRWWVDRFSAFEKRLVRRSAAQSSSSEASPAPGDQRLPHSVRSRRRARHAYLVAKRLVCDGALIVDSALNARHAADRGSHLALIARKRLRRSTARGDG
jgi:SAM-dependent methyltransferase